ncbi:TPA: hypothetical protein GX533_00315 [Candidatus Dojkabacteria bacterium]|jgi:hypothetical protein|uniref:Uncharacterized protein n=1 Tax=Candidatus Dojkabacteria bacterium TaxID=2099670 RepID=A0A832R8F9_9BACT|nr:hypothetical protein [Candidatus Dojkabacteria bacterium]
MKDLEELVQFTNMIRGVAKVAPNIPKVFVRSSLASISSGVLTFEGLFPQKIKELGLEEMIKNSTYLLREQEGINYLSFVPDGELEDLRNETFIAMSALTDSIRVEIDSSIAGIEVSINVDIEETEIFTSISPYFFPEEDEYYPDYSILEKDLTPLGQKMVEIFGKELYFAFTGNTVNVSVLPVSNLRYGEVCKKTEKAIKAILNSITH